jgi:hypothetical protein
MGELSPEVVVNHGSDPDTVLTHMVILPQLSAAVDSGRE